MDNFALEAIAAEDAQAAKCNNRFLQMAIVEVYFCILFKIFGFGCNLYLIFYWYFQNISADLDASKRQIQAAAERALGTAVNVVRSNV
jgi:hypothetical protein